MLITTDLHPPRTRHIKYVVQVNQTKSLLKSGNDNKKIGGFVTKGRWRGMPIHSLTLEERKTCPPCEQWDTCYGNNMLFGHRIDHTDPAFLPILELELAGLNARYPTGFLIRLHILGDFYDTKYAEFWRSCLAKYPALHIWGYTHVPSDSPIGRIVFAMNSTRCVIRASDCPELELSANVLPRDHDIVCPQQTNSTHNCGTCTLCWESDQRIGFLPH